MARLFVTSINLNKNELQNARIQNLSSAPSTPVSGQIYYDTSTNILYFYNGTSWIPASGSAEVIQDEINNTLQAGEGIDLTYNDGAGTLTIDAEVATHANLGVASFNDTDFTVTAGAVTLNAERVEDIVGGMVSTNTETLISVSYDDTNGKLNFAATDQFAANTTSNLAEGTNLYYTAERVQDEISTAIVAGTGLDSTYNDGAGTLTLDIDSTVTTNSGSQTLTNKTLGASTALGANLDAGTYKITNLGTPTSSADAATKAYVDSVAEGLHVHEAAKVYVGTNITIATALEAGDVVDGVTLTAGMRVLVNGQTTQSENGIYVVQSSGGPLRAADFDTPTEVKSGDFIFVSSGSSYGNTGWVQTLTPATIGTDPISFTQFSGAGTYTAGAGLTLTGTVFSADVTPTSGNPSLINSGGAVEVKTDTTRGLSVDANGLGINAGTGLTFSSGALVFASGYGVRKYSADLGDASNTSYTVTHSLGTKDITVHVYENGSPYSQVEADIEHTTTNAITVKFASAPSSNQYRVVIVG